MMAPSRSLALLCLLGLISSTVAAKTCPDPYTDPREDQCNPLKYIPSNTLTAIAVVLVVAVGILQTWFIRKWGAKWMCSMTIGSFTFGLGLATRFALHSHPQSHGIYILEDLLVVLSPCLFIAADYVLLGRLAAFVQADKYLLVSSRKISLVFVVSDVITFLIQASGGGLEAVGSSSKPSLGVLGSHVFLVGLIAQLVSFAIFSTLYILFLYRIWKYSPELWAKDGGKAWYNNWLALAGALASSSVGILIRSVFRAIEQAQGFDGTLATSEPLFYGLDTLPLFIAIGVYIPFWPGRFITAKYTASSIELTTGAGSYHAT